MQIVIELPDDARERIYENGMFGWVDEVRHAICSGTVLPKGHGRIVDIDNAVKDLEAVNESFCTFYARGCKPAVEYVGEVLIEADKEGGNGDSN